MVKSKRCVLATKGGQYMTVRTDKNDELKLVADDFQNNKEPEVYISEKSTTTDKLIAFRFVRGNRNYSIKVVGTDLKVEENDSFTNGHWFKKIFLGGEHFGLKSMETNCYLAFINNSTNVCLRPNEEDCVPVKVIVKALTTSSPSPSTT